MLRLVRKWTGTEVEDKPVLEEPGDTDMARAIKRRGAIAGVGMLLAGLLTKATEQKAYASDFDFLEIGNTADPSTGPQSASNTTQIDKDNTVDSPAFVLTNASNGDGLDVTTSGPNGIVAVSTATNGKGIVGTANTGPTAAGVAGNSASGDGVQGSTASASAVGVRGVNSNGGGGIGLFGMGVTAGVRGQTGFNGDGVQGIANSPSAVGVRGVNQAGGGNSTGVLGQSVVGGFGVRSIGDILCSGNFTATGTKSAVVPHPDGSHRALYCMESPQSWFEDFGTGTLANGMATVELDPDFAALVHNDSYHVFITPSGDSKGLYVSGRTATGFTVREQQGGTSSLAFDYRVVAKRKDVTAPRLAKVELPAEPTVAASPTLEGPQGRRQRQGYELRRHPVETS